MVQEVAHAHPVARRLETAHRLRQRHRRTRRRAHAFIAGQVGWNAQQVFESEALLPQFEQALRNVLAVLAVAGGRPEHICRMTAYCCDKPSYLAVRRELGAVWPWPMATPQGVHYPAMSMIFVSDLLDHPGKVELEATAAIPGV